VHVIIDFCVGVGAQRFAFVFAIPKVSVLCEPNSAILLRIVKISTRFLHKFDKIAIVWGFLGQSRYAIVYYAFRREDQSSTRSSSNRTLPCINKEGA
jgi:hypothetical protein